MEILPVFGRLLLVCIGIAIMGEIYPYAIQLGPFIYINFLLTLGFGFGIGTLTRLAPRY